MPHFKGCIYTKQEGIDSLRLVKKAIGHTPSAQEYNNCPSRTMSLSSLCKLFGSFLKAKKAAGLKKLKKKGRQKYTKEMIIKNIQDIAKAIGHTPSQEEYRTHPNRIIPVSCIKRTYFGTFRKAVIAAGLQPYTTLNKKDFLLRIYELALQHPEEHSIYKLIEKYDTIHGSLICYYYKTEENLTKELYKQYGLKIILKDKTYKWMETEMRRITKVLKRIPTEREFINYSNYPITTNHVAPKGKYKTYQDLIIASGVKNDKSNNIPKIEYKKHKSRFNTEFATKEQYILSYLRILKKRLKHVPTKKELNVAYDRPVSSAYYVEHFGSWSKALIAAKIKPNPARIRNQYTDQQIIQCIQDLANIIKHSPSIGEYRKYKHKTLSSTGICKRFGSWNNALKAAGLQENLSNLYVPNVELLKDLCICAKYLNKIPQYKEYLNYPYRIYSTSTIISHFGTWNKALEAAGLKEKSAS